MGKERHVLACVVRPDEHLHADVLVGEVAAGLALGIARATEQERCLLLDAGLVGLAHHLEVGDAAQVVMLNGLREVEGDVITGS